MKTTVGVISTKLFICFILLGLVSCKTASPSKTNPDHNAELNTVSDIFSNDPVLIERQGDAQLVSLRTLAPFSPGQRFRLHISCKDQGFVYVLCDPPSKKKMLIYPENLGSPRLISLGSDQRMILPSEDSWFAMPSAPGTYSLSVLATKSLIKTKEEVFQAEKTMLAIQSPDHIRTRGLIVTPDAWLELSGIVLELK